MKHADLRSLLARISARAPRQATEGLLEFIAIEHAARQAALFVPGDGSLTLFGCIGIEQAALDWTNATWRRGRRSLSSGLEVQDGNHALVPIRRGAHLVALLYLHTPAVNMTVILDVVTELANAIACAQSAGLQHPIDEYLDATPSEEVERRKMLLLLKRFEGRKSLVAKHLGVSRTTIYRRLEVLGIPINGSEA